MTRTLTHHTETAMWRSSVVRTRLHLRPAPARFGIDKAYGAEPGTDANPATATTRRGVPPH